MRKKRRPRLARPSELLGLGLETGSCKTADKDEPLILFVVSRSRRSDLLFQIGEFRPIMHDVGQVNASTLNFR